MARRSFRWAEGFACWAAASWLSFAATGAEPVFPIRQGTEFQVNTQVGLDQVDPSVAVVASTGDFIVVWATTFGSFSESIQGQRYDSNGNALGAQFQVNTATAEFLRRPSVAADSDGNFVVVWYAGSDFNTAAIEGQRYDSDGVAAGTQFQVSTAAGLDLKSSVAAASGKFVVVWESALPVGSDTSGSSIHGQCYDSSDGTVTVPEFLVNSYTMSYQTSPSVAMDDEGTFVVVWDSDGSQDPPDLGTDGSGLSVLGQLYDSTCMPDGGQFQVNTYTANDQTSPSVAVATGNGDFVVAWESDGSPGTDTSGLSIQGRRYDSSGSPLSGQFQVNHYTTNDQYRPSVAVSPGGAFVVTWQSDGAMFGDTDDLSIQAKIYDASGLGQGFLQFRVNTYTTNDQFHPSVAAALDDRSFVVTWASYGSYGTDEHGSSIQGQRYRVGNPSVPALPPSAGLPLGATLLLLGSYVLLRRSKRRPTSRASTWWSVTTGKGV